MPKNMSLDYTKDGTRLSVDDLQDSTEDRTYWRKVVVETSTVIVSVKGLMMINDDSTFKVS